MPPPSLPTSLQNQRQAHATGVKRTRPRGLWKGRGSGPRLPASPAAAPSLLTPQQPSYRRQHSEFVSDDDRPSYFFDHSPFARPPVTNQQPQQPQHQHQHQQHQHIRHDYFSAPHHLPDDSDSSEDNENYHWATRTKIMDVSTTVGPGDPVPSIAAFTYEDWLDLKQLFVKACEQYEADTGAETIPLLRGVIHECHRCLLTLHDPASSPAGPSSLKRSDPQAQVLPVDPPTSFHTLLGTTIFKFANLIAAEPELALPGEPSNPVPYWIAALDVFESGENMPIRTDGANPPAYRVQTMPGEHIPPIREDWRMAIMWGRTLVALATEMVDRARDNPIPPIPQPTSFPSPFPTNTDYLKTGTIWDEEPEWPTESPFGMIASQRPPITRRMSLTYATPHEILQIAMDHFSRGIFHMPHDETDPAPRSLPRRQYPAAAAAPHFTRSKELYQLAYEVLLLAEKLDDPEQRKEWAAYADSVFGQINAPFPQHYHGQAPSSSVMSMPTLIPIPTTTPAQRGEHKVHSPISDGMVALSRGRAWLVIGSTLAEELEEKMDEDGGSDAQVLLKSEQAEDARDALTQAMEFFERAKTFISSKREEGEEEVMEETNEDDEEEEVGGDDVMVVDEELEADDEKDSPIPALSARARGKQRSDPRAEEARKAMRQEAKKASMAEIQRRREQDVEAERQDLSRMLAECLVSLANLTEDEEQREELYRRAEMELGRRLLGEDSDDDGMDEDQ